MALIRLQLRSRIKWNNLTLTHRFSTSDDNSKPNSPFSSYFSDVKNPPTTTTTSPLRTSPSFTSPNPNPKPSDVDFDEIRKNLSEFRCRTSAPAPGGDPSSGPISFQEIYNRNVPEKSGESVRNSGGGLSFDVLCSALQSAASCPLPSDLLHLWFIDFTLLLIFFPSIPSR